jgi:hypothetical protein
MGSGRRGRCWSCGRAAVAIAKNGCAEHDDLCARCYERDAKPRRRCGGCGRITHMTRRARDGEPDLCDRCYQAARVGRCGLCGQTGRLVRAGDGERPALGRCCYEPPTAVCSSCGREAPCRYGRSERPLCNRCVPKSSAVCVDCGRERPARRRLPDGPVCDACYQRRLTAKACCVRCGLLRRPAGRTAAGAALCAACARVESLPVCSRCGAEDMIRRGLCPACLVAARVDELRTTAAPARAARLAPYLDALARSPNPASTLRWMQTPPFANVRALVAGEVELSHAGLDALPGSSRNGGAVAFLRAALVEHGVLEPRDEPSAAFARWLPRALERLAEGPDRGHVRAFAAWHVAHGLARASRAGRAGPSAQKHACAQVREAVKLVAWLHAQGLALAELRQHHIDDWLAAGASTRRLVRLFLAWLARTETTAPLSAPWNVHAGIAAPLDDDRRLAILSRLLHDERLDPRDRFAGALVLLLGQPLTRIAQLRRSDLVETDGTVALRLGRRPLELPRPLARIAVELRDQPAGRTRVAAADGDWLLPGRKHGSHLTAERLRERLQPLGIRATRRGRHGALLALAGRLPAPILAEQLGLHHSRAAEWVRAAGAPYADYVALLTHDAHPNAADYGAS